MWAPLFDTAGYVLNGARTDLANGALSPLPDTVTIAVAAGDVFGFYVESIDGIGDPGEMTIEEFTVVPVPAAVWMFASALGLLGGISRVGKGAA